MDLVLAEEGAERGHLVDCGRGCGLVITASDPLTSTRWLSVRFGAHRKPVARVRMPWQATARPRSLPLPRCLGCRGRAVHRLARQMRDIADTVGVGAGRTGQRHIADRWFNVWW